MTRVLGNHISAARGCVLRAGYAELFTKDLDWVTRVIRGFEESCGSTVKGGGRDVVTWLCCLCVRV